MVVARRVDRLEELAARYDGVEVLGGRPRRRRRASQVVRRGSPTPSVRSISWSTTPGSARRASSTSSTPTGSTTRSRSTSRALTRLSRSRARRDGAASARVPAQRQSVASFQPAPKLAVYAATKAYVTSLDREPARGGAWHRRARHRPVPGLTHDRVPECQQQRVATPVSTRRSRGLSADDVAEAGLATMSPRAAPCRCPVRSTSRWSRALATHRLAAQARARDGIASLVAAHG